MKQVEEWLATWAPHCGAPRRVFEGQFKVLLAEILDEIEDQAEAKMLSSHKLEGMHYAALTKMRNDLGLRQRQNPNPNNPVNPV